MSCVWFRSGRWWTGKNRKGEKYNLFLLVNLKGPQCGCTCVIFMYMDGNERNFMRVEIYLYWLYRNSPFLPARLDFLELARWQWKQKLATVHPTKQLFSNGVRLPVHRQALFHTNTIQKECQQALLNIRIKMREKQ